MLKKNAQYKHGEFNYTYAGIFHVTEGSLSCDRCGRTCKRKVHKFVRVKDGITLTYGSVCVHKAQFQPVEE